MQEELGAALLSSQRSDSRTLEAEKFWRGQGKHICFGDGPFFVCCLGRPEGKTSKAIYSQAPQCQFLGWSLRPWQRFLCGRLKKGDVFAGSGSVLDIKMRPPRLTSRAGSCSHTVTPRLFGGGGGGPGCLLPLCSPDSDHSWLWKLGKPQV